MIVAVEKKDDEDAFLVDFTSFGDFCVTFRTYRAVQLVKLPALSRQAIFRWCWRFKNREKAECSFALRRFPGNADADANANIVEEGKKVPLVDETVKAAATTYISPFANEPGTPKAMSLLSLQNEQEMSSEDGSEMMRKTYSQNEIQMPKTITSVVPIVPV